MIVDFKQTNKPKKEEWIEDYYLQLAAYAHAHNHVTGSDIQCGVVLMCSQDLQFQKFEMNEIAFQKTKKCKKTTTKLINIYFF